MRGLSSENGTLVQMIKSLYHRTAGKWAGCDWPTCFGQNGLKLQDLKVSEASLLAGATAGKEAAEWREAARWLTVVEQDAKEAQDEAKAAVDMAELGDWNRALEHIRCACAIEARYHGQLVWRPLHDAVEAVCSRAHEPD
jgi:hypothetical protein